MYRDPNMHVFQQRYVMRPNMNNNIDPRRSISSGRNGEIFYHDMENMARQLENYE